MKLSTYIFILCISFKLYGQKEVEKHFLNPSITSIHIDGQAIFKINVEAKETNSIYLKARFEGEESDHISIQSEIKNDSLIIQSNTSDLFKPKNDKLSAHKVNSIQLELVVPKHLKLYFKSNTASAEIDGAFKFIFIELFQGNCNVTNFSGNAKINTINGDITINTNYSTINAISKYGEIIKQRISSGKYDLLLHSINGNIKITKKQL